MNIAFVGCGYVADLYKQTLGSHLDLRLLGAFDLDAERLTAFATAHQVKAYATLDELLADPVLDVVVNLTPSRFHADVTRTVLEAGKHVYCDKLLALSLDEARALIELAQSKGLHLGVGPATHLSEGVQTLARSLNSGKIGKPLAVHAEMVTGFACAPWKSVSGASWPVPEDVAVGAVLENAGTQIAPLVTHHQPEGSRDADRRARPPGQPRHGRPPTWARGPSVRAGWEKRPGRGLGPQRGSRVRESRTSARRAPGPCPRWRERRCDRH
ncbi:Gfo/Idh/MocA family protein [Pararhodospirillum photometricum]|uniref:Gfo/Idh/MocA family protein n=1 Tax=Pararhodospirillum photometricum TaxID=1084 RepID=UPI0002EAE2BE|nr:Gfo/Idh/MocA family oxidoreductase [Pararhodospirillum photometricum]